MSGRFHGAAHRRVATALILCLTGSSAQAAIVCGPTTALSVPATTEGLYVNLVSGVSGITEATVPGFDIDIYAAASTNPSGQMRFYWGPESTGGAGVASNGDIYAVLGASTLIDASSLFTRAAFTGNTHAWQAGTSGYLGLRFRNEGTTLINYGWIALSTSAPLGFPATIEGWCYEDSGAGITTPALPDLIFAHGFEP